MARKKVNLAWIPNDTVRRTTFKKRRRGLLKKVSELATLCGVKACAVIYGPGEARPEVFPNEPEARQLLEEFQSLPETEQTKKMMNHENFLSHRVKKLADQLTRMLQSTREVELSVLMYEGLLGRGLDGIGPEHITGLAYFVDEKLKVIRQKMEALEPGARSGSGPSVGPMGDVPRRPGEQGSYMDLLGQVGAHNEEQQAVLFGSGGQGEIAPPQPPPPPPPPPFVVFDHVFGNSGGPGPWMGSMGGLPFFPTGNN